MSGRPAALPLPPVPRHHDRLPEPAEIVPPPSSALVRLRRLLTDPRVIAAGYGALAIVSLLLAAWLFSRGVAGALPISFEAAATLAWHMILCVAAALSASLFAALYLLPGWLGRPLASAALAWVHLGMFAAAMAVPAAAYRFPARIPYVPAVTWSAWLLLGGVGLAALDLALSLVDWAAVRRRLLS